MKGRRVMEAIQTDLAAGVIIEDRAIEVLDGGFAAVIPIREFAIGPLPDCAIVLEMNGCHGAVHLMIAPERAREIANAILAATDPERN